jgi:hypothetical protein
MNLVAAEVGKNQPYAPQPAQELKFSRSNKCENKVKRYLGTDALLFALRPLLSVHHGTCGTLGHA